MEDKERAVKAKLRLDINRSLLATSFTIFALIASLNPALFKESFFAPLQLTLAIPFLLSSLFARSKLAYATKPALWDEYGFFTFLIGYAFLINVTAILLSTAVGVTYGVIFLFVNIAISLVYSLLEIIEDPTKTYSRIKKDLCFAMLLLVGGLLPAIGVF